MNLSMAIFLMADAGARPVRVSYDPDDANRKFSPSQYFKTLDKSLKVDDFVIVPSSTRHGFTVGKVAGVDFHLDFDQSDEYQWIAGKVDVDTFKSMREQEDKLKGRIADAEQRRRKAELIQALSMDDMDLSALDIVHGRVAIPAPATVATDPAT